MGGSASRQSGPNYQETEDPSKAASLVLSQLRPSADDLYRNTRLPSSRFQLDDSDSDDSQELLDLSNGAARLSSRPNSPDPRIERPSKKKETKYVDREYMTQMRNEQLSRAALIVVAFFLAAALLSVLFVPLSLVSEPTEQSPRNGVGDFEWWKKHPIYQVYPRSFKDSNDDGIGDINGIIHKLTYLHELGIRALWLSPVYVSPMVDMGYDVSDFHAIDPVFGTMSDFERLVDELHKRGMYIIMDFVPNHTSDKHAWFAESRQSRNNSKANYYVWHDGQRRGTSNKPYPPNNWVSMLNESAWTFSTERDQFYLHQYRKEQPDLNYRSPLVQAEMRKVLQFWLEKRIDGFRFDAIHHLVEDEQMRGEPYLHPHHTGPDHYADFKHLYIINQQMTYDVVSSWVQLIDAYGTQQKKSILTISEAHTYIDHVTEYYNVNVSLPFNFFLTYAKRNGTAGSLSVSLREAIVDWMNRTNGTSRWPNWVLGNHDQSRFASRFGGREYTDVGNMLLLLLPGTPTCYQGDELGMLDNDAINSTEKRDPERTPIPWTGEAPNFGFSSSPKAKTWLPMNATEAAEINAERQLNDGGKGARHVIVFRDLLRLRNEEAAFWKESENFAIADSEHFQPRDADVICFVRFETRAGSDADVRTVFVIALSFGVQGSNPATIDLKSFLAQTFGAADVGVSAMTILLKSSALSGVKDDEFCDIRTAHLQLLGGQGVVLKFALRIIS